MVLSVGALFEDPFFLISLLSGLSILIVCLIMLKYPAKQINSLYGYRTQKSMQSEKHWAFAQEYGARRMLVWSTLLSVSSILGLWINLSEIAESGLAILWMLISLAIPIFQTESKLKKLE
jgi:uncharacterized membrane protein